MPLSEKEQEILQQIERQLAEDDPKFAREVASTTLERHAVRNLRIGVAVFLAGFLTFLTFFVTSSVPLGVVAFLTMLGGATLVYQSVRRMTTSQLERTSFKKLFGGLEGRIRDFRRNDDRG